jgi:hypothetical protein
MDPIDHFGELTNRCRQHKWPMMLLMDALLPGYRNTTDFIVAGMATMPSREVTFCHAIRSIVRQVDKLYLYLDGFSECPTAARDDARIVPLFSRDFPNLHANGKLLGLAFEKNPCLYVTVDDDLYYFRKFVPSLRSALAIHDDAAIVGYHASILARPLVRYNLDRTVYSYGSGLDRATRVDIVATGAAMFSSRTLKFDVRNWPFTNMVDLGLALEAARAGLPLIAVARKPREDLFVLAQDQEDSIYAALKRDDSHQTEIARQLLQVTA